MAGTNLALIGDLEKAGALTPTGLRLVHEISIDEYSAMLFLLGSVHTAMQFAIGDALIYGETVYGDAVYQASENLKIAPDTRNRYRRVAERVPMERRRKELSWSHHFIVSGLEPADQISWLDRAVVNNYSKHELESLIKTPKEIEASGDDGVTCPNCGHIFDP